ncbi:hypothetical protein TWF696_002817 [Orbilia brochopaga]|uniref:Transcription initiation factor TFIID subunit 2 n=1 Tax=Orbilia brochopaga TaxID=3140254 RepID=A0AAV9TZZ2_9PEZI
MSAPETTIPASPPAKQYTISKQRVGLDVDFSTRSIKGYTEISVVPLDPTLRILRFNCRQCHITRATINNRAVGAFKNGDPYSKWRLHDTATVKQWGMLKQRIEPLFSSNLGDDELYLSIPAKMKIELEDPSSANRLVPPRDTRAGSTRDSPRIDTPGPNATDGPVYAALLVRIEFTINNIRDGLHFVGSDDDSRYPHAFTTNSFLPGSASCLFPCIDDLWERPSTWDIEITCPRTLGDIGADIDPVEEPLINGTRSILKRKRPKKEDSDFAFQYHGEMSDLEMQVVCSGSCVNEFTDAENVRKKVFHFTIEKPTAPHQIAFAIGPFERAVLTENRAAEEDEALGRNAVEVVGYCLPGRKEEVENTCLFMQKAIDYMVRNAGHYPYPSFSLAFVDDFPSDVVSSAGLAVCSSRLLFKQDVIDPIYTTTKLLTVALASQWCGVQIIPKAWEDLWLTIGLAHFLAGQFLKNLTGHNEHRFRMKKDAEEICRQDVGRPALASPPRQIPLESSDLDFIALKAPVVLFILDRRLTKASSSMGVSRVISKLFLNAFTGDVSSLNLSTAQFIKQCEKVGHQKLDSFFNQWVFRSGYPRFEISQRFNKKKMIVEMIIRQTQGSEVLQRSVTAQSFLKEATGRRIDDSANETSPTQIFTGPMTIRIHEADGTPYEHVVQIHETQSKLEIPYNTKYKRLKRTRRQKERLAASAGMDINAEAQAEDVLLYCLGDVLQSDEDIADWRLTDFTKEEEDRMAQEAFEWIRVDADFEWICTMRLNQPDHMYLSQLQQDRDVTAQYEAVLHFKAIKPSLLMSTILVRTVMDRRYYYGIRCEAAKALGRCATAELNWIGEFHLQKAFQEFYCFPDSLIPRANDFSDFTSYLVQQAIITGLSEVRNAVGKSPLSVQRYLLDIVRYNDNSNNPFSDNFHMATLIRGLGNCLLAGSEPRGLMEMEVDEDDVQERANSKNDIISEIERLQRMDQWMSSYHNVISATCLDVKKDLVAAKVYNFTPLEFLAYSKEGTSEQLRIKAIDCMISNGAVKDPNILPYICYIAASDPSPRIRLEVFKSLMKGIGGVAVGDDLVNSDNTNAASDLTILEEGSAMRRQEEARRSIDAAIANLKKEIANEQFFKEALEPILRSTKTGFLEARMIINLCSLLYEDVVSLVVRLPMRKKRLIAVSHEGQGKLKFIFNPTTQTLAKLYPINWPQDKPRPPPPPPQPVQPPPQPGPSTPMPKLVLKPPSKNSAARPSPPVVPSRSTATPQPLSTPVSAVSANANPPKAVIKIKTKATPTPAPTPMPPPPTQTPKLTFKLKFKNGQT